MDSLIQLYVQAFLFAQGHFDTHEMKNIPDDTSFLEMLDILNEELIELGQEPFVLFAF